MNAEFYNHVKKSLKIADVIKSYMPLELDEGFYYGYCPFQPRTGQKLKDFTVNPKKNVYYCFDCHTCGDVISFVAHKEKLTLSQAFDKLCEKHNLKEPTKVIVRVKN